MTRIAVVGGHGQIGRQLLIQAAARGNQAVAVGRSEATARELRKAFGVETRLLDIESAGVPEFAAAMEGCDAVVFSAGAGPGSTAERKHTVDFEGTVKTIDGARAAGIRRYVQVSAMGVDDPVEVGADPVWGAYVAAKRDSDAAVRASGLDWAILRPGRLTNDPGTNRVSIGSALPAGEIARADVATVLMAMLESPQTVGRQWDVTAGEVSPRKAIRAALSDVGHAG